MSRWLRHAVAIALGVSLPAAASAETLTQAVQAALAGNPTLAAAQARQEALAEAPEQARSLGRLTVEANGIGGYERFGYGRGGLGTVSAALPIWTGGRVRSAVRAATADVAVGGQLLRDTAAGVIADVVGAYADLRFAQQALAIADADIELLDNQVAEAKARFTLGTGTATDVSRLVAQRASAAASEASAKSNVAAAAARYLAVVGHDPGTLADPPSTLARLPRSREEARARALAGNPQYRAALAAGEAATARIDVARANGAPSLGVTAGYGYGLRFGHGNDDGYVSSTAAGLGLRIPLLTGGLVSSQVREARANARAARFDSDAAAREAVRATDTAWANLAAARDRVTANEAAVAAADHALAGVKAEYAVGLRSTLDILIADESLRAAQLAAADSHGDLLTSETALLRAISSLDEASFGG